jgi:hypothetical protein
MPRAKPAWQADFRRSPIAASELDMRGYSVIVGVCWQKCRFLPDRAYPRFKGGDRLETDVYHRRDTGLNINDAKRMGPLRVLLDAPAQGAATL